MEEIKQELRQDNINVKCNAVAKLTYVSILKEKNIQVDAEEVEIFYLRYTAES